MINRFISALKSYLLTGTSDQYDGARNHLFFVSNLFSFIGYTITIVLAINAFIEANLTLSVSLFIASTLFFFCHQIHRFPKFGDTIVVSTRLVFLSLLTLMFYLIYSGGASNTGPLWIYLVPPVAFFFKGLKRGIVHIGIFVLLVALMLFYPNDALLAASYTYEFKTRLLYSFVTVSILFGLYEYSREQSYQAMLELSQQFEQKAMQDELTQLPNRRGMQKYLHDELERARRADTPISLLICDIDNFKTINDNYMHDGGDFILTQLSKLFSRSIRQHDIASRWGGEEFLFLLPNTSADDAFVLAEKLRDTVQKAVFKYKGKEIKLTLSIGLCEFTSKLNIDQTINKADRHLYDAKQKGRNKVCPQNKAA